MAIPKGISPQLIGKVVTIQVIKRESENSDSLDLKSMEKYVGTLQLYFSNKDGFVFQLVGNPQVGTADALHYVEIHPHVPKYIMG
jgi:hypothetical protein